MWRDRGDTPRAADWGVTEESMCEAGAHGKAKEMACQMEFGQMLPADAPSSITWAPYRAGLGTSLVVVALF